MRAGSKITMKISDFLESAKTAKNHENDKKSRLNKSGLFLGLLPSQNDLKIQKWHISAQRTC